LGPIFFHFCSLNLQVWAGGAAGHGPGSKFFCAKQTPQQDFPFFLSLSIWRGREREREKQKKKNKKRAKWLKGRIIRDKQDGAPQC